MILADQQPSYTYTPPYLPSNSALPGSTTFYHYHHPSHYHSNSNALLSTEPAPPKCTPKEHLALLRSRQLGGVHYSMRLPKTLDDLQIFYQGALPDDEPGQVTERARINNAPSKGFRELFLYQKDIAFVNDKAAEAYGRPAAAPFRMAEKTKNWATCHWYEFTLPVFNVPMKWAESNKITPDPLRPAHVPRKGWTVDSHKALIAVVQRDRQGQPLKEGEEKEQGGIVCARIVRPIDTKEWAASYHDECRIELVWGGLERVLGSGWDQPEVVETILMTGSLVSMESARTREAVRT